MTSARTPAAVTSAPALMRQDVSGNSDFQCGRFLPSSLDNNRIRIAFRGNCNDVIRILQRGKRMKGIVSKRLV